MVNALRFVDPTWDKAPHGHRLGPSILYLLGLRLYPIQTEESVSQVTADEDDQDSISEEGASDDDVAD